MADPTDPHPIGATAPGGHDDPHAPVDPLLDAPGREGLTGTTPATLYAQIQDSATNTFGNLLGIWKTTDAGATWTWTPVRAAKSGFASLTSTRPKGRKPSAPTSRKLLPAAAARRTSSTTASPRRSYRTTRGG